MLKLGIPSKGRLQEATIAWFADKGFTITRTGSDREYAARIDGIDGVEMVLLSAGEIPRELATGRIHLGVTGMDMVAEKIPSADTKITRLAKLGFGFANLIIAVPKFWIDVTRVEDLDAVAADFRATHGHRLRIATKYHNLTRAFLSEKGIADYQLVDSQGATEGTIKNLTAEAIADITTTGSTLEANHLKIVEGSTILQSEAALFRSETANWDGLDNVFHTLRAKL